MKLSATCEIFYTNNIYWVGTKVRSGFLSKIR